MNKRIKIIHIVEKLGGGYGRLITNLVKEQIKDQKLRVSIGLKTAEPHYYREILNGGIIIKKFNGFKELVSLMRENDIIHLHALSPKICFATIIAKKPCVYTIHGRRGATKSIKEAVKSGKVSLKGVNRLLKRFFVYSLYPRLFVNKCTIVSNYMKREAMRLNRIPEKKIVVIPNGITIENLNSSYQPEAIKKEFGISNEEYIVGTVTRSAFTKRNDRLILFFKEFKELFPHIPVKLLVIGEIEENIKKYAEDLRIDKDIIFAGFQENVYNFYPVMDIFILPSQNEAFSLVTIEAMAFKIPVFVFSDSGGAVEVVNESGGGVIVKNEKEMAEKIAELIGNKEKRKMIGHQGYNYVKEHWDIQKISPQYKLVYETIMGAE